MTSLDRLPAFDDQGRLQAVIESPQGSQNKLKYLPDARVFIVDHSLPAGLHFPFDFGFIPSTLGEDGDPLDILILMDAPAYPGCLVRVRLLGVIEAEQTDPGQPTVRNDRLIGLAEGSSERGQPRSLNDLGPGLVDQIEAFFTTYNGLRGKTFTVLARRGAPTARRLIRAAARS
jgi:inorganic pyrophosphatase